MSSYTDKAPVFNKYVAQKPVEVMARVGMHKQAQYQQGYEKIQDSIDNIAGLDIIRPQDKAHLQNKLNELGTKLQGVAAADFSNFQLSNSVAGMANNLIKDKGISGSVAATQRYKREQQAVDAAKKDGTLTPDNLYHYQKQVNTYFEDEEIGAAFNGQYKPYFDVFKFAKETFDEIQPDGMTYDQVFILGADGQPERDVKGNFIYSPAMTRMSKEGRFPAKVKATLQQIFSDPRVAQQLGITGEYNYRGLNSADLTSRITIQRSNVIASIDKSIQQKTVELNAGKDVQEEIDALVLAKGNAEVMFGQFIETAQNNPDVIRGMLYKNEVDSRYTTMFGQIKTEEKVMANPYADFQFKLQKEANAQYRWSMDYQQDANQATQDQINWEATHALNKLKAQTASDLAAGKLAKGGIGLGGNVPTPDFELSDLDIVAMQAQNYEKSAKNFKSAQDELIWNNALSNPVTENKLQEMILIGLDKGQALSRIIQEEADKIPDEYLLPGQTKEEYLTKSIMDDIILTYNNMTPEERDAVPDTKLLINSYTKARKSFAVASDLNSIIDDQVVKEFGVLSEEESFNNIQPQTIVFEDEVYDLTKKDIIDLAIVRRGTRNQYLGFLENATALKTAKAAEGRLRARGKDALITAIRRDQASDDAWATPISGVMQYVTDTNPIADLYRGIRYKSERNIKPDSGRDWSQVDKAEEIISNDESLKRVERKAEIINTMYFKNPNLKVNLLSGKTETDKRTIAKLGEIAGTYKANKQNLSSDFKGFANNINNVLGTDGYSLGAGIMMNELSEPSVEIRLYGNDNAKLGSMSITEKEANTIGVDVGSLYDTDEVRDIRISLKANGGKTSKGHIKEISTYINDDVAFTKNDLPVLSRHPANVKVNFKEVNGQYFPYVYINYIDPKYGHMEKIEILDGTPNLGEAVTLLKNTLTPVMLNSFITEEYARQYTKQQQQRSKE